MIDFLDFFKVRFQTPEITKMLIVCVGHSIFACIDNVYYLISSTNLVLRKPKKAVLTNKYDYNMYLK